MSSTLRVLISGGGFAGLTLAILLERAGIDYLILEKTKEFKPFGSAIVLGSNTLMLMDQLGILPDIRRISKPNRKNYIYDEDMNLIGALDRSPLESRYGYPPMFMTRYDLLYVLLSHVPPHKILMSKRILSTLQNNIGVMVRTSDGMNYHADLLVGCDGAYSGVRQCMYKDLSSKNLLPKADLEPMAVNNVCLVGVTKALDPRKLPELDNADTNFRIVVCKAPYTIVMVNVPGNRVCWMVSQRLETVEVKEETAFKNSGWGPEDAKTMCDEVRNFTSPFGGPGATVGDMIDATVPHLITKVMLEEKYFHTWYSGRCVLVGDSCHKINPTTGQGAAQAMLDAVSLANQLYDLPSNRQEDITKALRAYHAERSPVRQEAVKSSKNFGRIFADQGFVADLFRKVTLGLPMFMQIKLHDKVQSNRPQAAFLPFVEDKGAKKRTPQKHSARYLLSSQTNSAVTI